MKNLKNLFIQGLLLLTMVTLANCQSKQVNKDASVHQKSGAFTEISGDITSALHKRIAHICKIKFEHKGRGYKFTGVHSKVAIDNAHGKARIEIVTPPNAAGVYEARVFATGPDNIEIAKSGNGGKSTFFPDKWNQLKILEEAEYAIRNNKGFENGIDPSDGYYGYSKDGSVRIGFYYRDGVIISFFPSLKK